MTTIAEALRQYLLDDTQLAALIGVRIYPIDLPQNPVYPSITYQLVSEVEHYSQSGFSDLMESRFQFVIWDTSYTRIMQTHLALAARLRYYGRHRNVFNRQLSGIVVSNIRIVMDLEEIDATAPQYRRIVDAIVGYNV